MSSTVLLLRVPTGFARTWRQGVCGLRGHLPWLVIERDHLSVICRGCGQESTGLDLSTWRVRWSWLRDRHQMQRARLN